MHYAVHCDSAVLCLKYVDNRVLLVALMELANLESPDQIIEDAATELPIAAMYGAYTRALNETRPETMKVSRLSPCPGLACPIYPIYTMCLSVVDAVQLRRGRGADRGRAVEGSQGAAQEGGYVPISRPVQCSPNLVRECGMYMCMCGVGSFWWARILDPSPCTA